jgi:hypothetical protein
MEPRHELTDSFRELESANAVFLCDEIDATNEFEMGSEFRCGRTSYADELQVLRAMRSRVAPRDVRRNGC